MIEKLPFEITQGEYEGKKFDIKSHTSPFDMQVKINELVDAVNSIVSVQEKLIDSRFVVETKHEATADPYAEQRKWIGKLCKFWDDDAFITSKDWAYGMLTSIDKGMQYQYCCNEISNFKHCEPVKPTDSIIYKGGKDE